MFEFYKKYYPILCGAAAFIIYLTTIAPSVIHIDSGELAAIQLLPGIAHPTGYPLFSILGYIFSLIPLPFSKIFQLNLLAALYSAAGVTVFVYTARLVLDNIEKFQSQKPVVENKKRKKAKGEKAISKKIFFEPEHKFLATVFGGLILAFSKTFWFQSTSVEVYSLHILLINLIIFFLVKAYLIEDDQGKISVKSAWMIFAAVLALGFTNHMTTLLILPGVAYLYFIKYKFYPVSIKRIGVMLLFFFPVLIVIYAYFPIMASQEPLVNWGNPIDYDRIIRHVQGKQYQVWLFSSTEAARKQFAYFWSNLPSEFTVGLLFSFIGMISSLIWAKRFFLFVLINFLFTILYSINYDINDIDSYFLLSYISLAFFALFGALKILRWINLKKYSYTVIGGLIAAVILFQIFITHYKVDQSDKYIFEDYTKELIGSVSKNAIIFSYQWDYFISPSYYYQFVENYRRDAAVVDKELIRRSWYFNQLDACYPGLLNGVRNEINLFLKALEPFEKDEQYNSQLLENLYRRIMTGLVSTNIDKRDFYVAPEVFENEMQRGEFVLPEGYTLVPDLFLFKVVKGNEYVPAANPDFKIRLPKNENHYTRFIQNLTGSMLARRALYEIQFDKRDRAKLYVNKIKTDFPAYTLPQGLQQALE